MTSRIPPSRRAPEFAAQRAAKAMGLQTPGAGRVTGAARPAVNDGVQAALRGRVSVGGSGTGGVGGVTFARDRFALTASGAQTKYLTSAPGANSQHAYLNGIQLDEGTDYSLSGRGVSLLSAAGAVSGDVLDVRYAVVASAGAAGYESAVLLDGPELYWRLGDPAGSTTAADSSGNSRPSILSDFVPTFGSAGLLASDPDTCITTAGSAGHLMRTYEAWMNLSAFTVECLIKVPASGNDGNRIIMCRDDWGAAGKRSWQFKLNGGQLQFIKTGGTESFITSPGTLTDDVAHHVAAVYDGTQVTLYVDGEQVAQDVCNTVSTSTADFYVGAIYATGWGYDEQLHGSIDEVAVYSGPLSADQIAAHFAETGL